MNPNKEQIVGTVRHLLTFAGGYLVAKGKLSEGDLQSVIGFVTMLVGWYASYTSPDKQINFDNHPELKP